MSEDRIIVRNQIEFDAAIPTGKIIVLGAADLFTITSGSPRVLVLESRPSIDVRDSSKPSIDVWDLSTPSIDVRDSSTPSIDVRDSSKPSIAVWDSSTPSIAVWDSSKPSIDVWDSSTPSIDVRDSSKPSIDVWGSWVGPASAPMTYSNRDDLIVVLDSAKAETPGLLAALQIGKVNGSCYDGECACLVGTLERMHGSPFLPRDVNRPAEQLFMPIRPGMTPKNSAHVLVICEWIKDWAKDRGVSLEPVAAE